MEEKDRALVLTAAAYGPLIALRLSIHYLRMRRKAVSARRRFYRELRTQGLPKNEAKYLADVYGSSVSVRSMIRLASGSIPFLRKQ